MNEVIERVILKSYVSLLPQSFSPTVSNVLDRLKDIVEREALDAIYPELKFDVTEDDVSLVLVKTRSAHTRYGEPMFDAQNILFIGWLEHLKLLKE